MQLNANRSNTKTQLFLETKDRDGLKPYAEFKNYGGWDPESKHYVPIRFTDMVIDTDAGGSATNYALDSITLSYESGTFQDHESFLKGAFVSPRDLLTFCEQLHDYQFWLNERHFYAFLELLNLDESEMRTYEEVADALEQAFENL
jgi:hypothetical protein